jgi:3-deoxy-D-manno-octulosonic-acid transferase
VWLGDTLGELGLYFRVSRCAFVGRSLAVGGGQNPIEPARLGVPVIVGPKTENFVDAVAILKHEGALVQVEDQAGLTEQVRRLLANPDKAAEMGAAGRAAATRVAELPDLVAARLLSLAGMLA